MEYEIKVIRKIADNTDEPRETSFVVSCPTLHEALTRAREIGMERGWILRSPGVPLIEIDT
jgi:hypothetical protein